MVSVWIFFAKLGFVVSTMASSVAPVASSVASASDNDEAANRHEAVVSSRKLQRAEVPPRPPGRYMAWSQLSDEKRTLATTLFGYANDGSDWNLPGTATFEVTSYSDLTPNQLQGVADVMGITGAFAEDIWDCWIAHYGDYFWSELATENVQQWYIALGWSEASWDFGTAAEPATEATDWVDLTEEEKEAARQLCFDQNMWDDVNLEIPMTDTPTVSPTTEMPTGEEYTRYVVLFVHGSFTSHSVCIACSNTVLLDKGLPRRLQRLFPPPCRLPHTLSPRIHPFVTPSLPPYHLRCKTASPANFFTRNLRGIHQAQTMWKTCIGISSARPNVLCLVRRMSMVASK